jgi:UDP-N-acetylmuramate dehydrogenase
VYGNAHFKGRSIDELIDAVRLVGADGVVRSVPHREMEFAYDYSRLHRTREIVVSADFRVSTGDPTALRATARDSLAFRKRTQPLESPSAGCIFQNPDPLRERVPDGIPASAGALVDRAGLKGAREGAARVSTTHANFIVNEGGATARDIRRLIDRCKTEVLARFGVSLREEIMYLGEGL